MLFFTLTHAKDQGAVAKDDVCRIVRVVTAGLSGVASAGNGGVDRHDATKQAPNGNATRHNGACYKRGTYSRRSYLTYILMDNDISSRLRSV